MKVSKRTVRNISLKNKVNPDDLLIALWYFNEDKFDYLEDENSVIKTKDIKAVSKTIKVRLKNSKPKKPTEEIAQTTQLEITDFDFSTVGKPNNDFNYLNEKDVLVIYEELVKDFNNENDPIEPSGIKDQNMLSSALTHPQTSYESNYKYPTVCSAAAALMYGLSHNHPFYNGNKRTSIVSTLVFLDKHKIMLTCKESDLFKLSLKLARHELVEEKYRYPDAEVYELARWLHNNSKSVEKGERIISLKKLKQILSHFDCTVLENGKVEREKVITRNYLFVFPTEKKFKLYSSQSISTSLAEGKEVSKSLIRSIRQDLELTDEFGIDSEMFYSKSPFTVSDFISRYKNLLKRLSRV